MAEGQMTTNADIVAKILAGEHGGVVREVVAVISAQL